MKITADTNLLVRAIVEDDARQSRLAQEALAKAELVAIATPALCELIWVLARGYKIPAPQIAAAVRRLIDSANVAVDRPSAESGLALLEAGGDFADGAICFEGAWLGGESFVSFDREAVRLIEAQGDRARLLS